MNPKIIPSRTEQDFETVEKLAREIWTEHYAGIVGTDQVEYMLAKFQTAGAIQRAVSEEGYVYAAAFSDGTPVGYFAVKPEARSIFLSKIYIKKAYRGRGFARVFLSWICENFGKGRDFIWLTVNKNNSASIAAYHKLGFETECELRSDIGNGFFMDDYRLVKTL